MIAASMAELQDKRENVACYVLVLVRPHVFNSVECYFRILNGFAPLTQHLEVRAVNSVTENLKRCGQLHFSLIFAKVVLFTVSMQHIFWNQIGCIGVTIPTHSCTVHCTM